MQTVWFRKSKNAWFATLLENGRQTQVRLVNAPNDRHGKKLAEDQLVKELAARDYSAAREAEAEPVPSWTTDRHRPGVGQVGADVRHLLGAEDDGVVLLVGRGRVVERPRRDVAGRGGRLLGQRRAPGRVRGQQDGDQGWGGPCHTGSLPRVPGAGARPGGIAPHPSFDRYGPHGRAGQDKRGTGGGVRDVTTGTAYRKLPRAGARVAKNSGNENGPGDGGPGPRNAGAACGAGRVTSTPAGGEGKGILRGNCGGPDSKRAEAAPATTTTRGWQLPGPRILSSGLAVPSVERQAGDPHADQEEQQHGDKGTNRGTKIGHQPSETMRSV